MQTVVVGVRSPAAAQAIVAYAAEFSLDSVVRLTIGADGLLAAAAEAGPGLRLLIIEAEAMGARPLAVAQQAASLAPNARVVVCYRDAVAVGRWQADGGDFGGADQRGAGGGADQRGAGGGADQRGAGGGADQRGKLAWRRTHSSRRELVVTIGQVLITILGGQTDADWLAAMVPIPDARAGVMGAAVVPTQRDGEQRWEARSSHAGPAGRPALLSPRELQVLRALAEGSSNGEIARELFVSEDTVKTHVRHLYRKLQARDRGSAVASGFRAGLLR